MMKQFLVPCNFNGVTTQVPFYIGNPAKDNNPLQHQAHWLSSTRGGVVSQEVMDSLQKLNDIATKNNILVVDLCEYALMSTFPKKESILTKSDESNTRDVTSSEPEAIGAPEEGQEVNNVTSEQ